MENASFSSRIKELRGSNNLTQTEFAEKIGTTQATLSSYENTNKTPSLDIVKNIAETFSVSIDWILGLSDIMDVDDNPQQYSDVIRLLFKLEDANIDGFYIRSYYHYESRTNVCEITFNDPNMIDFIGEWQKMKELHDNSTIDDELYDLWIEKTLKKYSKPIHRKLDGFMNIPDATIDEELPFN